MAFGYSLSVNDSAPAPKLTWKSPYVRYKVLLTALAGAFAIYGFFTWILWPVKVAGESMMPNYRNGSRHFINKLAYWSAQPQRGDVVGLLAPNGDIYLKRVIGLPGEHLTFDDKGIYINGRVLLEPYIDQNIPTNQMPASITLSRNEYWVIGDNRATSVRGPISRDHIIGKLAF